MNSQIKFHQGDVIGCSLDRLPEGAVEVKNSPIALGETHGHAHVLTGDVKRYQHQNRIFFLVLQIPAILQHTHIANMESEEAYSTTDVLPVCDHKPITLPPGLYEFWIQNQYNPYKKLMEQVRD